MYNVKNRSAGVATYKIPELGVRRSFQAGEVKKISAEELEKLTYRPGGMALLANFLQIMEPEAIAKVGLRTEPEYNMSEKDIIDLMKNGSLDEFLDCLDFAPPGVIDLIKKFSVSLPMTDFQKVNALKAKTGFDAAAALKHVMEEKEDDGQDTILKTSGERRVKKEESADAPARRTAPKYNVVSTDKKETITE
jgi:predicted DNA-binding protein